MNLKNLTDQVLIKNTENLVKRERELLAEILWHLREIDRRRLFCDFGCNSLYQYAVKHLGYSEDQAFRRINAARLLESFPEIEEKINTGELNLTHLSMAQNFFRAEEKARKLGCAEGQMNLGQFNKEQKSAQKFSREDKLAVLDQIASASTREAQKVMLELSSAPTEIKHPERQKPVTSELSELNFLVDEVLLGKINQLKGLLAHTHPHMSLAELVSYLCDMGLEKLAQPGSRKSAAKRPAALKVSTRETKQTTEVAAAKAEVRRAAIISKENSAALSIDAKDSKQVIEVPAALKVRATTKRTYISVKTRREVWLKAQNKCEKCGSTHALEIDHRMPISCNGSSELENLRLLCRKCNQRTAIEKLGQYKMNLWLEKI